jgi:hypothetical protein
MKTTETKLAESIANAVDDHWFNPAILAHLLSNQPHFTIDRIMEIVAHLLKFNSKRYKADFEQGVTSEGLFISNELNSHLNMLSKQYKLENLKLPKETKKIIKGLPDPKPSDSRYSWLDEPARNPFDEVQKVSLF